VELETFVAPPPPRMPAMSPPAAAPLASPPPQAPPKPPAVEEVEAIADEEEHAAKADEIVSIPDEELVADRISEVDPISAHDEITVDVDEPIPPPKRPPPPLKRSTSVEPPATPVAAAPVTANAPPPPVVVTAPPAPPPVSVRQVEAAPPPPPPPPPAAAGAAAAPMAAQTLDLGRKRAKPWWEEIFSDDFIRTLEKVEPKAIRKECDFIEERLGLEKGAVMLDLCCGNGAHAVELASRGYNVVGYDLSLAMLARAQDEALDRGQRINFLQGDVREMAFDEAFDGMYSWSTSFGYFEDDKNLNVLSRIHRGLRKGGIFLLDVINRDYVCPRQPSLVWFEGEGCVCMDEMFVDFFSSRLRVKRTVMFEDGRSRECDYAIRLYGLHELGKMLHETGFKVLEVTGHPAHPGVFFGSESPRIIVLAERG
jgi:ubiquinone/menaquinone biosynthesis C-methylase UbiE